MAAFPYGWQVENASGTPVSGAKIYFYVPTTTTPRNTFTDTALTVPAANPVLADAAGWFRTYVDTAQAYDIVIRSADDAITYQTLTLPAGGTTGNQPVDATLTAIAGLTFANGEFLQATGVDTFRTVNLFRQTYAALTAIIADDRFDEFWSVVPRKIAKDKARPAYLKALRSVDADTIIHGMARYAESRAGQDPQYTAHPASWLNAGRWADETEPTTGGINGNSKDERRIRSWLAGASIAPRVDSGPDTDASQPLLARR